MTAIEVLAALEKALKAYEADKTGYEVTVLITAATAESIRNLLDAHASALRDAARYRWLRDEAWSGEHAGKRLPHVVVFRPGLMPSAVHELAEDALDDVIDRVAALDDNTKGAAK